MALPHPVVVLVVPGQHPDPCGKHYYNLDASLEIYVRSTQVVNLALDEFSVYTAQMITRLRDFYCSSYTAAPG